MYVFNHETDNVGDACVVESQRVMELAAKTTGMRSISEIIEVILNSDYSEVEKLVACHLLGGFREHMVMKLDRSAQSLKN